MIGETRYKRKSHTRKRIKGFVGLLAAVAVVAGGIWFWQRSGMSSKPSAVQAEPIDAKNPPQTVAGRYLFSGTIVLARAVERAAQTSNGYNYDQPFSQMDSFGPDNYDAWAADLECPVTTKSISYEDQVNNQLFNCRRDFLPALHDNFPIVNIANDHTDDLGPEGFAETKKYLEEAGIQSFGGADPANTSDSCEMIALPVRLIHKDKTQTKAALPMSFCAWQYHSRNPLPGEIEVMQRFARRLPVFGFIHVGTEYLPKAGGTQVTVAHKVIDEGAEFVIGNGAHWVQNAEVYKGKPIFYSTGNFIFDEGDTETQRGLSIDLTISVNYDDNVAKWLALGETCKPLNDSCLEQAEKQDLKKYDLTLTYVPVASSGGNKMITRKANTEVQAAVEQRLNWPATLKALNQ